MGVLSFVEKDRSGVMKRGLVLSFPVGRGKEYVDGRVVWVEESWAFPLGVSVEFNGRGARGWLGQEGVKGESFNPLANSRLFSSLAFEFLFYRKACFSLHFASGALWFCLIYIS